MKTEQTLEELMEQVRALWDQTVWDGRSHDNEPMTFEAPCVWIGVFRTDPYIGVGVSPREALLDLRQKLLAVANKKLAVADKLRAMVRNLE